MVDEEKEQIETVISGSFRKHLEQIQLAKAGFEQAGVLVRAPGATEAVEPGVEFVILASDDRALSHRRLQTNYMRNIAAADFLFIANIDGYVGRSAATEMAYARLKGLPIITAEPIQTIAGEIPEMVQELIRASAIQTMPISDITKDAIMAAREYAAENPLEALTDEATRSLSGTVLQLIRDLGKNNI